MPTLARAAPRRRHSLRRGSLGAAWQRRRRRALASGLELVVAEAERPYVPSAAAPIARRAVRECRTSLLELAAAVRAAESARPCDVLLVRRLLTDPDGPLFQPTSAAQLRAAADFARGALEQAR